MQDSYFNFSQTGDANFINLLFSILEPNFFN